MGKKKMAEKKFCSDSEVNKICGYGILELRKVPVGGVLHFQACGTPVENKMKRVGENSWEVTSSLKGGFPRQC